MIIMNAAPVGLTSTSILLEWHCWYKSKYLQHNIL